MMRKLMTLVGVALVCGCGQSGAADAGGQRGAIAGASMEVAGVRPGMTMDEARRVLEGRGYKVEINPGQSYESRLAVAVSLARGVQPPQPDRTGGIYEFEARKGPEEVSIRTPPPGPGRGIVPDVVYSVSLAGRAYADVVARAKQKYGQPTKEWPDGAVSWCTPGDDCTKRGQRELSISLSESTATNTAYITAVTGTRFQEESKAKFDAAVAAVVGKPATSF